ncbi:hypothetical protein JQ596_38460 [Bradyrhizobium manausense]|uniref:hypothetical protein n=1 Tax=Bradyrhizobium manausense TaxID=989370 RepID=UPI001BA4AC8D|nr:hypothetical protein [Bradyrhizobium manausense]MBR0831405.1 hypothetical protein [Bradyrhizobium manausense]
MPRRRAQSLNDPHRTATHEAGHAVIGRVLTLLCGGATIVVDYEAGSAGHTITEDPYLCESWLELAQFFYNTYKSTRLLARSCLSGWRMPLISNISRRSRKQTLR